MFHPLLEKDIEMGLPLAVAQDITDLEIGPPLRWLYSWAFMIIMIAGFAVGGFFLWPTLSGIVLSNAISAAQALDGQAVRTNFGFSMLLAMFLWITSVGLLISVIISHLPSRHKATFYLHSRSDFIGPWPKLFGLHHVLKEPSNFKNGVEYIDAICSKMTSTVLKIVIPMFALCVGIVWLEMSWYQIFTPTHYLQNPFLSNTLDSKKWSEASEVKLGCNFIEKRNGKRSRPARNRIVYEIIWSDGTKVRLSTEDQINSKSWLDNFETIDASIRTGNAVFYRWEWKQRDPLHTICVKHYRTDVGQENELRFDKLLRIGELD